MERQNEKDGEIENKVKMIFKDVEEGNMTRAVDEVDELRDLQRYYESRYRYYDHCATVLKKRLHDREEKDGDHSSKGISSENGKCRNKLQKLDGSFKQELEAVNGKAVDLKQKDAYGEKEASGVGIHKVLSSVDDGGKRSFEDLEIRIDQLKEENSTLWVENVRAADLTQGPGSAQEEKMPLISKNAEISQNMEQEQGMSQELVEEDQGLSRIFNENEAEHSEEELSGSLEYEMIEKLRLEIKADQLKEENSALWVENVRPADLTRRLGSSQEEKMPLISENAEISQTVEQELGIPQALIEEDQQLSKRFNENEAEHLEYEMTEKLNLETRADQLKEENLTLCVENVRPADLTQGLGSAEEEKMPLISKNAEISQPVEQELGIPQELIEEDQQLSKRFNENEAEHSEEAWSGSLEYEMIEKLCLETRADQLKEENSTFCVENVRPADLTQGLGSAEEEKMPLIIKNVEISQTVEQKQGIRQELIEEDQQLSKRFNENEAEHSEEALSGSLEYEKIENLHLENCWLKVQVADLKLQVNSLLTQKGKLGAHIKDNSHEAPYLREENQLLQLTTRELHDQNSVRVLLKVRDEISNLLKKLEDNKNEESARIMALTALVKVMQELDSSHSQKIPLELHVAGERQEAAGRQTQENKNIEFTGMVSDMQNLLKEHEDEICKLTIEYKQLEDLNQESLSDIQDVDKMIKHVEQLYLRDIAVEDEITEWENRKVRFRNQMISEFETRLVEMKASHKDLQEKHKSELEKVVAMVERQCQTIKQLMGIQEENPGQSEKEDKVLSLEEEKKEVIRQFCIWIGLQL